MVDIILIIQLFLVSIYKGARMDYYVKRVYPSNLKQVKFQFIDDEDFGMINLCCVNQELYKIKQINDKIIQKKTIEIYFPLFDYFYIVRFQSPMGWTLRRLIKDIEIAGLAAMTYYALINHEDPEMSRSSLGEYALTWSPEQSDIEMIDDKVYISLQH